VPSKQRTIRLACGTPVIRRTLRGSADVVGYFDPVSKRC
jgi:hypothetical protein